MLTWRGRCELGAWDDAMRGRGFGAMDEDVSAYC